jgi:XRE family aerobic/anaerobic benzoate catabolism transcriptional regulator
MQYSAVVRAAAPVPDLLAALGRRVRALRAERGTSRAALAEEAGLSPRFLAEVEAGRGNISVRRLADLARALGTTAAALLDGKAGAPPPARVALLGLRGAGKSTVGRLLAKRLGVPFHELDALVERASGLPLAGMFAVHGEAYFRRVERETLERLLRGDEPFVLAVGGGLVTEPETYAALRRGCRTVWLRAKPEEHMARVAAQGDLRPMSRRADAMTELRGLLAARTPLYAQADLTIDTSRVRPEQAAARIATRT